jgi:hypothetical protein
MFRVLNGQLKLFRIKVRIPNPGSRIRKTEKFTQEILPEIVHHVLEKTAASGGFRCCSSSGGGGTARSSLTAVLQLQVTAPDEKIKI